MDKAENIMKKKVLLLDGHTRQVLPTAKALREAGHHVTVLCPNKVSIGFVSRWPNERLVGPDAKGDPQGFLGFLENLLKTGEFDIVIPHFDYSAHIVSMHKQELKKYAVLAVNNYDVFIKARDKALTMQACQELDVPCTKTYYVGEQAVPEDIKIALSYPLVVKPVFGESARGFHIVENVEELNTVFGEVSKNYGKTLIQEFVPQNDLQYKCEVFIGNDNQVKAAVVFAKVRWYPIEGGSSTFNLTVDRPDIVDSCVDLLKGIGWRGYADVDLIQDKQHGVAKVMEINPRITGSVKIAFDAGVDFANMIVNDSFGKKIDFVDYEIGRGLRLFHKDLLWFIKSKDRFRAKPSWFNFFDGKTSDQIFSFSDPLPGLFFTFEGIIKLFKGR